MKSTNKNCTLEEMLNLPNERQCGAALRGARYRIDMSVEKLSTLTGISKTIIQEMESGNIFIDEEEAKQFDKVLDVGYKVFLQRQYI